MRKVMIAGNWKMNKTFSEGVELALALNEELKDGTGDVEVVVCPPAVDLKGVAEVIEQNDAPFGLFGETDEDINKKAKALMAHGIVPISCCGEPLEIREAGTHVEFVVNQIKADTADLVIDDPAKYVIAYEPIWAIGTGKTATADDAQEVCGAIRETLVEIFGAETAAEIRVLYGGSANEKNIADLVAKPDVDGALVGGASLKAPQFAEMVKNAQ